MDLTTGPAMAVLAGSTLALASPAVLSGEVCLLSVMSLL